MIEYYRPIMAVHIIAIISWMAGILYLYRLLIYATEQGYTEPKIHALLSLMARRLFRYITMPAMIVSWILGLSLVLLNPDFFKQIWFHVKFLGVLILSGTTLYAGALTVRYGEKTGPLPTSKTLRIMNEVPTLLMVIIVVMVVVKPFLR